MYELLPKLKQVSSDVYTPDIMESENNQDLKGIEHIGIFYNVTLYKKVL